MCFPHDGYKMEGHILYYTWPKIDKKILKWGGSEDDQGDFSRHYTFVFYEGWKVSGNLLVQPVGEHGDGLKRARKQQR